MQCYSFTDCFRRSETSECFSI